MENKIKLIIVLLIAGVILLFSLIHSLTIDKEIIKLVAADETTPTPTPSPSPTPCTPMPTSKTLLILGVILLIILVFSFVIYKEIKKSEERLFQKPKV